jgi:hypothetical protein
VPVQSGGGVKGQGSANEDGGAIGGKEVDTGSESNGGAKDEASSSQGSTDRR